MALHEALADTEIADRVAVAMLPEDAVEIAGYEDLLVSIVDRAPGASDERRVQARARRSRHHAAGLERLALEQLGDRVLILVVENLDRVFRDLGDSGRSSKRCSTSWRRITSSGSGSYRASNASLGELALLLEGRDDLRHPRPDRHGL